MLRPLIATALFVVLLAVANAHGPAEWIERGGYQNPAGERDCVEINSDDIAITAAGYFIKSLKETVPFSEATPSPTGTYWRCFWGGKRKCFFAPPPNS